MRTSNQFNKHGFVEGAKELRKIAQEVAEDKLPAAESVVPVEKKKELVVEPEIKSDAPEGQVVIPPVDATKSNIAVPDFSNVSYGEALKKLEEINAVISERAVVRALAGVDIMLSQLGIASYFAELSEAQSKLLDSFQYASTRIAQVISQLRGRSLNDVQQEVAQDKVKSRAEDEKKNNDTVEVGEELGKPVGEISNKAPQQAVPPVQAPKV
jgi:hypothetical protein